MQSSKEHIAQELRNCLPSDKKEASWGVLAAQFPWYPMVHWLRAAEYPQDGALLQKAALFAPDVMRLHGWLHTQTIEQSKNPVEIGLITEDPESASTPKFAAEPVNMPEREIKPLPEEPIPATEEAKTEATLQVENTSSPTEEENITPLPGLINLKLQPASNLTELPLEPYYSVDYFASQGIKVDKKLAVINESQLDLQVRSFTEWLKTMKRLKYQPATEYADPLVEAQAKKSLLQKEIVTEAMAEVWLKQGNFSEAARVYARLMLLHPEKTPYFASRLQEINQKQ